MPDPRPQYQHGTGTIGDQTFHWGSGSPGQYWSIPYGDYPVTPDAPTGDWAHKAGAIPIANNVIPDAQLGRDRIGIMIHSGSSDSLDKLYTQGCFKVAPSEWPQVRAEILKEAGSGPLYLHVQPGGQASFTNTKTLAQTSIPTAGAPGAPVASGTPINSANAPVPGALANQGPESVGSQPAYTFTLPKNAPMGMGNNNPLNIKYYKGAEKDYTGLIGPSDNTDQGDPQMKFGSPEAGWNAAYSLLNKKYAGGKTTPNMIIAGQGGWTPGNTAAAANVAKLAGIGPDDDIGFGDKDKAHKFMRALVTQEQGEAAKAYPDEMIAASIGGNAPAAGAPPAGSPTAVAAAPAAPAAPQSWLDKLIGSPVDKDGNPTGAKSPLQELSQASIARLGSEGQTERQEAPQSQMSMQGPGVHMPTGPSQAYGMTLNSFSTPLTWARGARALPGLGQAGLQGVPVAAPGVSLNSVLPSSQGLGYGIDDVGYGYG